MAAVPLAPAVKILRAVWLAAAAVPETCRSTNNPEVRVEEAAYSPVPVVKELAARERDDEVVVEVALLEVRLAFPEVSIVATKVVP